MPLKNADETFVADTADIARVKAHNLRAAIVVDGLRCSACGSDAELPQLDEDDTAALVFSGVNPAEVSSPPTSVSVRLK